MTVGTSTPTKYRFGAVSRTAFSHDMLNVHFYGIFREVEPDGNQLVGKAELQCGEHVLLARRQVGHRPLGHDARVAVTLVDDGRLRSAGTFREDFEARRFILPDDR